MIYIALQNSPQFGGGVEQVVNNLLNNFPPAFKKDLLVLCNSREQPAHFEQQGVACFNLRIGQGSSGLDKLFLFSQLRYSWALRRFLQEEGKAGDIVNIHGIEYSFFPSLAKREYKLVITAHGCLFEQFSTYLGKRSKSKIIGWFFSVWRWYIWLIEKSALDRADALVFISTYAQHYCQQAFSLRRSSQVIANGISGQSPKKRAPKKNADFRAVIVGSKTYLKGLDIAVTAVQRIREEGLALRLCIVGFSDFGLPPEQQAGIEYIGRVLPEEVVNWYDKADFLLLPSRFEVAPLTVLEALQRGLPVLVSKACHLETIPSQSPLGYAVADYQVESWLQALRAITDQETYNHLLKAVQKVDFSVYDWKYLANQYQLLYQSLQ